MLTSLLLEQTSARRILRSIIEADLPARGLAHVISVRAVAQGLEDRWPQRREAVWEFLDRSRRRRAAGSICVQLDEAHFLLAFPSGEAAGAAARSIDILRDVLQHFLGRSDQVEAWVRPVTSLEAELAALDADGAGGLPAALHEGGEGEPQSQAPRRAPPTASAAKPPDAGPRWTPLEARSGRDFAEWRLGSGEVRRMAMQLRPVWSLRHEAVSSFRLYRGFNPATVGYGAERERVDFAVLDYATGPAALGFLQQRTFLHLPVALSTLLLQRSRLRYLEKVREARHHFRHRVLLELEGVEPGVVESRLQEAVHVLRPYVRLVLASSSGQPLKGSLLRSVGVSGCVIDLAAIPEPMTPSGLLARVARAQKETPIVVVHGLYEGEVSDAALRSAGATHASSRPGGRGSAGQDLEHAAAMVREAAELRRIVSLIEDES